MNYKWLLFQGRKTSLWLFFQVLLVPSWLFCMEKHALKREIFRPKYLNKIAISEKNLSVSLSKNLRVICSSLCVLMHEVLPNTQEFELYRLKLLTAYPLLAYISEPNDSLVVQCDLLLRETEAFT